MKRIGFVLILSLISQITILGQSEIVKLDFENGSFKNFPQLPFGESFIIEGEVMKDVEMVEVNISYSKAKKSLNTYQWNRAENNQSETFEMFVSNPLRPNDAYDFDVVLYQEMTASEKDQLQKELTKRIVYYLKNQIVVDGKNVSIDNPRKVYEGLNELIKDATVYQRSKNGIEFDGLTILVENEIKKMGDIKLKNLVRKKKALERDSLSNQILNTKLNYLADIVISEIKPFLNSTLLQQKSALHITGVETKKDKFSLPINGGLYVWNTNTDINNVNVSNTSITPGFGLTIPFSRGLRIKQKSINSFGLSLGVLSQPITNGNGDKLATPSVNLPVYGALGVKFFNLIRVNAGALVVSKMGSNSVNNLQFYPTLGVSLELNLWLGVKK